MTNLSQELLNRRRNPKLVLLWIYLLIGLVVCFVGGAMALIYFTGRRMAAVHGPLIDAVMEIKLETATAHLWFEELIGDDQQVTIEQVVRHIDQANWYAKAMLEGGQNLQGVFVALTDPNMREDIQQVQEKLGQFRSATLERWQAKDTAGIGSEINQRYDVIFSDLLTLADRVETDIKLLIKQNLSRFSARQVALVIICLIVTVIVSVFFGRVVFRQIEDEQKLIALNQQLDAGNQQLVANEQQLKAANQQLLASEQQLKAANQQLRADEQQLKAANQQLVADEQKLKAANQQLMASEQQLRAANQQLIANEKRLRQSQRELREQRDKAQQYLDVAGVMFVVLNNNGEVTLINPKGCEILACSRDEVIGKNWFGNFLPQSLSEQVKDVFHELMEGKLEPVEYYENPVLTKDGRERIIAWHNTLLQDEQGQITGILSSGADITERKQAEEEIIRTKEEWERTFTAVPDLIALIDNQYKILRVNKAMADRMNISPQEAEGLTCYEVVHGTREPPAFCPYSKLLSDGQEHTEEVYEESLGGHYFTVSVSPLRNNNGDIVGVVHVARDITEHKQAEEALRESEKRFREFAELLPEIVGETNNQGRITFVNHRAYDVFGYSREDFEGKLNVFDILAPEDHARASANIKRVLAGEDLGGNDYMALKKDGSTFPITVYSTATLRDGKPAGIRAIIVDITRQRETERQARQHQEQLQHVSRLSTVGEMASGLAHEINQPLSAIMSYANASLQSLKTGDTDNKKVIENIKKIAVQSKRAGEIIRRIRDFARKSHPERKKVDINSLVKEMSGFVEADIRKNKVDVNFSLTSKQPKVIVDAIQIEQVLLNLVRNAIEAMADSGSRPRKLTIRTRIAKSGQVELAISDNGHGIEDKYAEQIFDPFFTTKSDGLGIGLSISRSIVEAHGSTLSAKSNPDGGSTFKFTLPIIK